MAPNNKKVKKRVDLSLMQKLELIKKLEEGVSVTDVSKIYNVTRHTAQRIHKSKTTLQQFLSARDIDSSKLYISTIENKKHMTFWSKTNIDKALYKWYSQQRSCGINVQHHQLKLKLEALITHMGLSFNDTQHWLWRFKKRYGIASSLTEKLCSKSSKSEKKNINQEIKNTKYINQGPNQNLDRVLYKWYSQQRSSGINVQQIQLKSQLKALITHMGLTIKNTEKWLTSFRKRHRITSFLSEVICSESSDSEKKNINQDQVTPDESIKVENLPSLPFLPPTASTYHNISEQFIKVEDFPSSSSSPPTISAPSKIFGESVKVENFSSESCSSPTDVYHNYIWEEYDIKSEGSPSPLDDKSLVDK
ncbi:PREDICTED: uncharacterized protein LOC105563028 [Vollenhovia emeryi]|uniref:uncharacterized protein LOC105563028 n=1 Tax=Vollenhovia emeryi TaxID=411798 RepID=UPI0005F53FCA|nr:PREDICTED: uncharacterized protein LOC105563028 [Vollenhovia emeryi]XP_011869668.1 PREDICTED: uncharacterized protein LOC105563028 [Vollenhovia emeryi]XP_011869669.1 PREDICTED: uncharacterized protein LOC105563028 [Vollenhovia emeryi]XP_011869670.1 PREDICTED: uncharacterized protein LOC105563028 [Vollenhovia emeryi]